MGIEQGRRIEKIILWLFFLFFFASQIYFLWTSANSTKGIKPVFQEWAIAERGPWKLDWQVNSSDNKPRINYKKEEVLRLNGRESKISFSGLEGAGNFGLHEFSFSEDEDTIYNSYIGEDYAIEQINEVHEEGVRLKFFFSPFFKEDEFENLKLDIVFTIPSKEAFYSADKNLILWTLKDYLPKILSLQEFRMELLTKPNEVFIEQIKPGESKLFISYHQNKINQRVPLAEFFISN